MSARTMDLYLIQDPDVVWDDGNSPKGYNRDLLRYYKNSIPIRDIWDFVGRITFEVARKRRLIKNLIIGAHGSGLPDGTGNFKIGRTWIIAGDDDSSRRDLNTLRRVAPFFVRDADVYIVACRTGNATPLL